MDCVGYVVKWVHGWFRRLWRISAHSGSFGGFPVDCLFGLLACSQSSRGKRGTVAMSWRQPGY